MSELDSEYVKRGYWVNLQQGPVMGQTITTDTRTGAFIIALVAVLSSIGLKHLWNLATFCLHQMRANGKPSDGLFRQQQVLLRSSPTASTFVAESLKLWYTWRHVNNRAAARSVFPLLFAVVFTLGSLAAGIFSSYLVSASNIEVLVSSSHCGYLDYEKLETWNNYLTYLRGASGTYAEGCYREGSILLGRCNVFMHPNIPIRSEFVPCPFDESMCTTRAFALDSGIVDINDMMGLNLAASDRVGYRKRTTCSMLSQNGYTSTVNATDFPADILGREPLPGEQIRQQCYGKALGSQSGYNCTFVQSSFGSMFDFSIKTRSIVVSSDNAGFELIPPLRRSDADVGLKVIATNRIRFTHPVDDPMFSAHIPVTEIMTGGWPRHVYGSDEPTVMLGCAVQYQYCFHDSSGEQRCSKLVGRDESIDNTFWEGANDIQLAIAKMLRIATQAAPFGELKTFLIQSEHEGSQIIGEVPDDQWIAEITHWEATTWAAHQIAIADYAIGPTVKTPAAINYTLAPSNSAENKLCGSQKMRKSGGFVNINVFGLIFIITLASVIYLVDVVLLRSLTLVRNSKKRDSPRIDRWIQDGVYQLQRKAYEAQGEGVWTKLTSLNPLTIENTKLHDLAIETRPQPTFETFQKTETPLCVHAEEISRQETASQKTSSIELSSASEENQGPSESHTIGIDSDPPILSDGQMAITSEGPMRDDVCTRSKP